MEDDSPLRGYYIDGQFVTVKTPEECEQLRLLGCYGQDLASAKRKEDDRRGPLDKLLIDKFEDSEDKPTTKVLTLHEAFFLGYALGCLQICSNSGDPIDLLDCWDRFRRFSKDSNNIDFAIEYGVYHYFKTRGWVVKTGENYGVNFLLYKQGPSIDHAHYGIKIIHELQNVASRVKAGVDWRSLQAAQRVNQSVGKELLIVYVVTNEDLTSSLFRRPDCMETMKIMVRNLTCKTNLML